MSNDEKRDIEDRINDAMAKIVSDTAGEPQPENKNNRSAAHKSARPSKDVYKRQGRYTDHRWWYVLYVLQSYGRTYRNIPLRG